MELVSFVLHLTTGNQEGNARRNVWGEMSRTRAMY